jgi:hypothetical protein
LYCEQLQLRLGKMSRRAGAIGPPYNTNSVPQRQNHCSAVYCDVIVVTEKARGRRDAEGHTRVTALPAAPAACTHNKSYVLLLKIKRHNCNA